MSFPLIPILSRSTFFRFCFFVFFSPEYKIQIQKPLQSFTLTMSLPFNPNIILIIYSPVSLLFCFCFFPTIQNKRFRNYIPLSRSPLIPTLTSSNHLWFAFVFFPRIHDGTREGSYRTAGRQLRDTHHIRPYHVGVQGGGPGASGGKYSE